MITALIFDFDGLLVDTETPAFESWQAIYAEHGHELTLDLWKDSLGTSHGFDPQTHLAALVGRPIDRELMLVRRRAQKRPLERPAAAARRACDPRSGSRPGPALRGRVERRSPVGRRLAEFT